MLRGRRIESGQRTGAAVKSCDEAGAALALHAARMADALAHAPLHLLERRQQ